MVRPSSPGQTPVSLRVPSAAPRSISGLDQARRSRPAGRRPAGFPASPAAHRWPWARRLPAAVIFQTRLKIAPASTPPRTLTSMPTGLYSSLIIAVSTARLPDPRRARRADGHRQRHPALPGGAGSLGDRPPDRFRRGLRDRRGHCGGPGLHLVFAGPLTDRPSAVSPRSCRRAGVVPAGPRRPVAWPARCALHPPGQLGSPYPAPVPSRLPWRPAVPPSRRVVRGSARSPAAAAASHQAAPPRHRPASLLAVGGHGGCLSWRVTAG